MKNRTTDELVRLSKKNNSKAQEILYYRHVPKLYGIVIRYVKNRTDAEDIIQDGFIKIFTNLNMYHEDGKFASWAGRLMVNLSIDFLLAWSDGQARYNRTLHFVNTIRG